MTNGGLIKETFYSDLDYDYEVVCGGPLLKDYPIYFKLAENCTGTQKDQKDTCACVAMTISSIAEAYWNNTLGEKGEHSEGFIYSEFRKENSKNSGLIVSVAMEKWRELGTVPKLNFDLLMEMPELKDVVAKYPELFEIAKNYRLSAYTRLRSNSTSTQEEQIKDALLKYGYGLVAVDGNHCMQLVGWDDEKDRYILKDSYGKDRGTNGYITIPKSGLDQAWLPIFEPINLPFVDVPEDAWYYKTIRNMYLCGIAKGTSEQTFEPDRPLTRAEGMALIERVLKEQKKTLELLNRVSQEKEELKKEGYKIL